MILLIFIKTENRRWFPEPEGRGDEELSFNGYRVSVVRDEKSFRDRWYDGCTNMWMYLISLNYTVLNG